MSDLAETTSVSIGCYGYRPYMFGCIDHVGVKQIQPLFILAGIIRSTMTKDAVYQFIEVFVHRHCTGHYPISGGSGIEILLRICCLIGYYHNTAFILWAKIRKRFESYRTLNHYFSMYATSIDEIQICLLIGIEVNKNVNN